MSSIEKNRKENNISSKNLTEENQNIFTAIVCYLRVSDIKEEEQEEIISDILRMFLDWQEEGKSVESMVGEDYKSFTDNIIAAINPNKAVLKRIKEYLGILADGFCIMLTIDFVFLYLNKVVKGNINISYNYTADQLMRTVVIVIIASILINYVGKNSFKLTKKRFSKFTNFIFGCSAAIFVILLVLFSKQLNDIVLVYIKMVYVIGLIIVYWSYKGLKRLKK